MRPGRQKRNDALQRVADASAPGAKDRDLLGGPLRAYAFPLMLFLAAFAFDLIDDLLGLPDWARSAPFVKPAALIAIFAYIVRGGYKWWLTIDEQAAANPKIRPWARLSAKYGCVGIAACVGFFILAFLIGSIPGIDKAPSIFFLLMSWLGWGASVLLIPSIILAHIGSTYLHSPDGIYYDENDPNKL